MRFGPAVAGIGAPPSADLPQCRFGFVVESVRPLTPGMILALGVSLELRAVEVDVAQVAGGVALASSLKCGDDGLPLSPPAVTALARTVLPNSTTATKLLPLVPYHFLVSG